jgi:predicted dehydrogenase
MNMKQPIGFLSDRASVRWGIIGCGAVAEMVSGPAFQKAERSALVAVMRRDGARAEDFARRHGVPRWYSEAEALINDPEVDAVYVATPPGTHAAYALQVAAAGKPAYVEKPMARNTVECDQMVDAFARAGLPLFVAYYRRRMPRFLKIEELIKTGVIGRVTGLDYRMATATHRGPPGWYVDAAVAGAGHFLSTGSHVLDLLDYLFGPLADVAGNAANRAGAYMTEDTVALSFRAGGIPGAMLFNYASEINDDTMRVTGTAGQLSFSMFGQEPLRLETAQGVQFLDYLYPPHAQQPIIQSIVDDLLGKEACPSTGESAQRTSALMDQVLSPFYGGRQDEFWARPQTWPGPRQNQAGL